MIGCLKISDRDDPSAFKVSEIFNLGCSEEEKKRPWKCFFFPSRPHWEQLKKRLREFSRNLAPLRIFFVSNCALGRSLETRLTEFVTRSETHHESFDVNSSRYQPCFFPPCSLAGTSPFRRGNEDQFGRNAHLKQC